MKHGVSDNSRGSLRSGDAAPRAGATRARIGAFGDEISRRAALVSEAAPEGTRGPRLPLLLAELGTMAEVWSETFRARRAGAPRAAGRPRAVMLLPGFGTHPTRMGRMRRALSGAGHRVHDWGLGWNLGADAERFDRLVSRVEAVARREGEPLALVGWSLGGLYAREVAKAVPGAVGLVITMGTPFSGDRRANNAWRAYQGVTGHNVDAPPVGDDIAAKPPVPTVAIWSPRDGIVATRAACGRAGERDRQVAVRCTHLGFAGHPAAILEVLRQLDGFDIGG
jgi:pimeloyl-ACP methyl ester carboxylesterase